MKMDDDRLFKSWKGSRWGATKRLSVKVSVVEEGPLQREGAPVGRRVRIKGANGISYGECHLSGAIDDMGWRGTLFCGVRVGAGFVIPRDKYAMANIATPRPSFSPTTARQA